MATDASDGGIEGATVLVRVGDHRRNEARPTGRPDLPALESALAGGSRKRASSGLMVLITARLGKVWLRLVPPRLIRPSRVVVHGSLLPFDV